MLEFSRNFLDHMSKNSHGLLSSGCGVMRGPKGDFIVGEGPTPLASEFSSFSCEDLYMCVPCYLVALFSAK